MFYTHSCSEENKKMVETYSSYRILIAELYIKILYILMWLSYIIIN
jgi:hypothetical protein